MGHLVVHGAAVLRMRVTNDSRTLLGTVASGQNNRQRIIVLRTVARFKFNVLIHAEILQQ